MNKTTIGFLLMIIVLTSACIDRERLELYKSKSENMRVAIITSEYGGYGYDIFRDGKLTIHQPHIPASYGLRGFATKEHARKAAKAVVEKLQQSEDPPTLTLAELEKMGVFSRK
jgi:tRNA(Ile2) C34 agmatinyltransferase TiaS